ncbi:hypothetical protein ACFRIC_28845 [Streptomyces sp. NPDC056738]|uniref:hypothetical protein n=1 Tax=Streptomyces sp. NPDC056738 TaxID=3345933 RepID=UPI003696C330
MPVSKHDPHNARELAAVLLLGVRIDRRKNRGKSVKRLENRVAKIREDAQKRENQRGK